MLIRDISDQAHNEINEFSVSAEVCDDSRPVIRLIKRSEIHSTSNVSIGTQEFTLGIHKDFHQHPLLKSFIPDHARLSLAWVHLGPSEVLEIHSHPTKSMIIVAYGIGHILGELEAEFTDGDVIIIPSGCTHGFSSSDGSGFWALSVQFEGAGLYEDLSSPRVAFIGTSETGVERLLRQNDEYAERYKENRMFALLKNGAFEDKECRDRYLDGVQVWSRIFQRVLLARSALTEDPSFFCVFKAHLEEEYDHDIKLANERGNRLQTIWDPALESASHWFVWKMLTLDNRERTVLVHLVLEVGSSVFSKMAHPVFAKFGETEYFAMHDEADAQHRSMGLDLLTKLDDVACERLVQIQREGWDMLNLLCNRLADLACGDQK